MSYALGFGPDFFWNGTSDNVVSRSPAVRPTSIEQAVLQLSDETWTRLARDVFHCEPEFLTIEAVLEEVHKTNTCLNLDSPVEVMIDCDSEFTVLVYDRDHS